MIINQVTGAALQKPFCEAALFLNLRIQSIISNFDDGIIGS